MPRSGPRRPASFRSRDRRSGVQEALLRTWPGRAIVAGLAARIAIYASRRFLTTFPAPLSVLDTAAGIAIAVGAGYFVFRLALIAKRHLLWRVRRKLILSYIFIGFIPALLIVSFFLLCGLLLFFNISSYLVQTRLRALEDRARLLATNAALEIQRAGGRDIESIMTRRQNAAAAEFPGASLAVVPMERACGAPGGGAAPSASPLNVVGPWRHVAPPASIPAWIDCGGYSGLFSYSHVTGESDPARSGTTSSGAGDRARPRNLAEDTHMFVRATMFPESPMPGYAVVVDLLVGDEIRERLRSDTGVEIEQTSAVELSDRASARPMRGRPGSDAPRSAAKGGPLNWITFLDDRDWDTGAAGTLLVSTQPEIAAMYQQLSATQGMVGSWKSGQILLFFLVIVGSLFLVIESIALVAGLALAKSITGSVHELFTGTQRVRQGDFTHKIAVQTEDQLGELAGSFNTMTASIEDFLRQAEEKKRLEEELRIAREIQMSLLPQGPWGIPGLAITALCVPAREVGGDYFDFFRLGDRRLGILIADVSGKGTSAAFYMAELKGLMLSLSEIHTSPRQLLLAANRIIAANLDSRSFITMTYAVVDLDAATMTYARAGHTPLIYVPGPLSSMTPGVHVLAPDGLVLGLNIDNGEMFERLLVEQTIPLHPGDVALFFTDGISEAMNETDDFFGEGRLGRLAEEHAHLSSDELRERVLRDVEGFVGAAPQHDDMTMILIKVEELPVASRRPAETVELAQNLL